MEYEKLSPKLTSKTHAALHPARPTPSPLTFPIFRQDSPMVGAREFAVDSVYKIVPREKSLQGLGGFRLIGWLVGWLGLAVRGGSRKISS